MTVFLLRRYIIIGANIEDNLMDRTEDSMFVKLLKYFEVFVQKVSILRDHPFILYFKIFKTF